MLEQSLERIETKMTEIETTTPADIAVSTVDATINEFKTGDITVYSSMTGDDFSTRLAVAAALTNSTPINDKLGEVIALANIVMHAVEFVNEDTGKTEEALRTILIDADGNAYHAVSQVIVRRLRDIFGVIGEPATWPSPVNVIVTREQGNGARFFFDLRVI